MTVPAPTILPSSDGNAEPPRGSGRNAGGRGGSAAGRGRGGDTRSHNVSFGMAQIGLFPDHRDGIETWTVLNARTIRCVGGATQQ
jgi:hypothetical protein